MANQTSNVAESVEIAVDRWEAFFVEFTRRNRGAHASLEILGGEAGYQVETEGRQFDGIALDWKDNEHGVWITFASTVEDHLAHGIPKATAIHWREATGKFGEAIEIEGANGTKAILELSRPEDFALPPGTR